MEIEKNFHRTKKNRDGKVQFFSQIFGLKPKGAYSSSLPAIMPYGITQCYLPSDTSERAPP